MVETVRCAAHGCEMWHEGVVHSLRADGWRGLFGGWYCPDHAGRGVKTTKESKMDRDESEDERIRQQQQLEQQLQSSMENMPMLFKGLYDRYMAAGFTADQALKLVCCQAAGSVRL